MKLASGKRRWLLVLLLAAIPPITVLASVLPDSDPVAPQCVAADHDHPGLSGKGEVAHGGGLNSCGCHIDHKTGYCHCHRPPGCGC